MGSRSQSDKPYATNAFGLFMRGLAEEQARDAALLAQLEGVSAATMTRLAADGPTEFRVRRFMARHIVYVDDAGICHVDHARLSALQQRRARRRVAAFIAVVVLLLLPVTLVIIASLPQ